MNSNEQGSTTNQLNKTIHAALDEARRIMKLENKTEEQPWFLVGKLIGMIEGIAFEAGIRESEPEKGV